MSSYSCATKANPTTYYLLKSFDPLRIKTYIMYVTYRSKIFLSCIYCVLLLLQSGENVYHIEFYNFYLYNIGKLVIILHIKL